MCFGCSTNGKIWWSFTCAAICLIVSIPIGVLWPTLFTTLLNSQLKLTEYTIMYQNWIVRPIPLYMEIYLFNWTNIEEIENWETVQPHFVEMGPYVFEESAERIHLNYSEDGISVFYHENKTYIFKPELSNGHLSDRIFNINPIATTINWFARLSEKHAPPINIFIGEILQIYSTLYIGKTAEEWLFEGFHEGLLDSLQKLIESGQIPPGYIPDFPYDKFGWFYKKNGSYEANGQFEIWTGKDDVRKSGLMKSWNGRNTVPGLRGECAKIQGTTAEVWPPVTKNYEASFYIPDLCRTITFKRDGTMKKLGVNGFKWSGDDSVFDNGEKYPEAKCWCTSSEDKCPVYPSGIYDASSCSSGAPAFMSFPHFYLADEHYLKALEGLNPNKEKHGSYIVLEPTTGVPLEVRAKFQINMYLRQDKYIPMFKSVPNMFVPMLWFNQKADLDRDFAGLLNLLILAKNSFMWLSYLLGVLGAVLFILALVFIFQKKRENRSTTDQLQIQ